MKVIFLLFCIFCSLKTFALDCENLCPNGRTKVSVDEMRKLRGKFVRTETTEDGPSGYKEYIDCAVEGNCPNLKCRNFGIVTYMMVKNANITGSHFEHFGYGEDLTNIIDSDLRCTKFDSVFLADGFYGSIYNHGSFFGEQMDPITIESFGLVFKD